VEADRPRVLRLLRRDDILPGVNDLLNEARRTRGITAYEFAEGALAARSLI
jgi:hypothetical protein